jgi:hypothetical protein
MINWRAAMETRAPEWTLLVRLLVGLVVFFPEGIHLIMIMLAAIVSTKVPIWLGHDFWIFHVPKLARYGFWSMAHEAGPISACCSDHSIC